MHTLWVVVDNYYITSDPGAFSGGIRPVEDFSLKYFYASKINRNVIYDKHQNH